LNRREFLQSLGAFLAVATLKPTNLLIEEEVVDWSQWNEVEIKWENYQPAKLLINGKDQTRNMTARRDLSRAIQVSEKGVHFGPPNTDGCTYTFSEQLPASGFVGFAVKFHEPPKVHLNIDDIWIAT
jgi:hypothetical protein